MLGKKRSDCPIHFGLRHFGDAWTLLIIRDLLFKDKHAFREFSGSEEKIATNILTERLTRLEGEGIVKVSSNPDDARSKYYALTPKGRALAPILVEMILWSAKYDSDTAADRGFIRRAKKDRDGLLAELMKG
jgi:DNA-binding HxlR family transcriptional regulator